MRWECGNPAFFAGFPRTVGKRGKRLYVFLAFHRAVISTALNLGRSLIQIVTLSQTCVPELCPSNQCSFIRFRNSEVIGNPEAGAVRSLPLSRVGFEGSQTSRCFADRAPTRVTTIPAVISTQGIILKRLDPLRRRLG